MTPKYRVDCKLANQSGPYVRSEPKYIQTDEALQEFIERQGRMKADDPFRLEYVINVWDGHQFLPLK